MIDSMPEDASPRQNTRNSPRFRFELYKLNCCPFYYKKLVCLLQVKTMHLLRGKNVFYLYFGVRLKSP